MKIILLSGSNSRYSGGLYNSVRRLAQTLDELPNTSANILAHNDNYTPQDIGAYAPLLPLAYTVKGPINFGFSPDLSNILAELSPDIVHSQCIWMYLSYANVSHHKRVKTPYMISPRGMLDPWALQFSAWKKKIIGQLFEHRHLRGAACMHALGEPEFQSIRKFGLKNPIAVIPNAIDLPNESLPKIDAPWSISTDRKILLFLGRIHPKKGIESLLYALQLSKNFRKDWFVAIAGESNHPSYTFQLENLIIELGLASDVQLIGPQFHEQKDACFRNADAFILPSYSEGLPMAVLEAWAYKLPVLMTLACNLPEGFVREAALEVSTVPLELSDKLDEFSLLSKERLDQMGNNGFALVLEKFTWTQVAYQMKSVYDWVLGGGQRPDCIDTI